MVSELPTGKPNEQLDREWLRRIRFGLILLFWTLLLQYVLSNAIVHSLLLTQGITTNVKWSGLIHVIAGVPVLIGVWAITARAPGQGATAVSELLRCLLRVLACLEIASQAIWRLLRLVGPWTESIYLWLPMSLVAVTSTVLGLLYLAHMARRFGLAGLGRSFRFVLWAYIPITLLGRSLGFLEPEWTWLARSAFASLFLALCLWIWALALLSIFSARLTRALQGQCIRCGYLLVGLPEPRCPECGQPFVIRTGNW